MFVSFTILSEFLHFLLILSTMGDIRKEPNKMQYTGSLISAMTHKNRRNFILQCIEEKVPPYSTFKKPTLLSHPFPEIVESYLKDSAEELHAKQQEHFYQASKIERNLHLNAAQKRAIQKRVESASKKQIKNLENKLTELCENSLWNTTGRPELVKNLSDTELSKNETLALSYGLKFAVGTNKMDTTGTITKNHRYSDSEFERGFIQGLISATLSTENEYTLPKRFVSAIQNLSQNKDLVISPADKGGGVVVMNTTDYNEKMLSHLNDENTYEKVHLNEIDTQTNKFTKEVRKALKITMNPGKNFSNITRKQHRHMDSQKRTKKTFHSD